MQPITMDDLFEIAIDKITAEAEKDFLFVFNTIQSSLDFHTKLKLVSKSNVIYLSGNIIPKDRLERIERIKYSSGRKIVISTQLVEAGVDIDLDIVFRDFAPFDSIIQTAGRCNRNGKDETGEVYLFTLIDERDSKKYCNYIYKPLSLKITDELLRETGNIKERDLLNVLKIYYIKTKKEKSNNISRKIISDIAELNYDSVNKEFELIEKAPNILVFVEKDDEASKILNQFKELLKLNIIDIINKFFKIKKSFYDYVLSVRINKKTAGLLGSIEEVGNFKLITKDMIKGDNFYNNDVGLNFEFENFI
jgi:CRISPR-associated endonuclease/helicase Cas3